MGDRGSGPHKGVSRTTGSFVWLTVWPKREWGRGEVGLDLVEVVGGVELPRH